MLWPDEGLSEDRILLYLVAGSLAVGAGIAWCVILIG